MFLSRWIGAYSRYVVAAILRDTLTTVAAPRCWSLLNGITCTIPVLAPVLGHLIMLEISVAASLFHDDRYGRAIAVLFILHPGVNAADGAPQQRHRMTLANRC